MNPAELDERYHFARRLIDEAGELALGFFQRLDTLEVKSKGVQDMASEADVEVERLIRGRLAERFPQDGFLGEESGRSEVDPGAGIWVVDPIDGTQPFVNGMSSWCVSIAFVLGGALQMGFVASPARGELFSGRCGGDAELNGTKISVQHAETINAGIVAVGYSPRVKPAEFLPMFSRLLEQGGMFYRDGSGALALCYVACGRLIGYVEPHINSWDCLGALAVIEAAGGRSNPFLEGEGLWKGNRLIAGSPALYPALEALFRE